MGTDSGDIMWSVFLWMLLICFCIIFVWAYTCICSNPAYDAITRSKRTEQKQFQRVSESFRRSHLVQSHSSISQANQITSAQRSVFLYNGVLCNEIQFSPSQSSNIMEMEDLSSPAGVHYYSSRRRQNLELLNTSFNSALTLQESQSFVNLRHTNNHPRVSPSAFSIQWPNSNSSNNINSPMIEPQVPIPSPSMPTIMPLENEDDVTAQELQIIEVLIASENDFGKDIEKPLPTYEECVVDIIEEDLDLDTEPPPCYADAVILESSA